jgi:hypothetical protein
MPSKNEIWVARITNLAWNRAQFGQVTTDMVKLCKRQRDMIDREIAFHLAAFKSSRA